MAIKVERRRRKYRVLRYKGRFIEGNMVNVSSTPIYLEWSLAFPCEVLNKFSCFFTDFAAIVYMLKLVQT